MLLEKVIRKNNEMFQNEASMRKPFFSKSTRSSNKKEFLHILFPGKYHNFTKNVQKKKKKKPSEKFLTGLASMNIFTDRF